MKITMKIEELINILEYFRVYEFEDVEGKFWKYLINEKKTEKIKELVEEYKESEKDEIDLIDFLEFLKDKGYSVIALNTDHCIYF